MQCLDEHIYCFILFSFVSWDLGPILLRSHWLKETTETLCSTSSTLDFPSCQSWSPKSSQFASSYGEIWGKKSGETPWSLTSASHTDKATWTSPTRWQKIYGDHFIKIAATVGEKILAFEFPSAPFNCGDHVTHPRMKNIPKYKPIIKSILF